MNGGAHTRYFTLPKMDDPGPLGAASSTPHAPVATGSATQGLRLGSHSLIALRFLESPAELAR